MFSPTLSWREALIRHASSFDYIREYAGPNAGEGVQAQQSATGNKPPDYWCCSFVYRSVRTMLGKVLLRSASCQEQREYAAKLGALRTREQFRTTVTGLGPEAVLGWVFLSIDQKANHAHHTGLVGYYNRETDEMFGARADSSFVTIEGNAADPRKPASRDGNGVYGGRLRGNSSSATFGNRLYQPDAGLYEFIDLDALNAH